MTPITSKLPDKCLSGIRRREISLRCKLGPHVDSPGAFPAAPIFGAGPSDPVAELDDPAREVDPSSPDFAWRREAGKSAGSPR
jgi:hypothetical protein